MPSSITLCVTRTSAMEAACDAAASTIETASDHRYGTRNLSRRPRIRRYGWFVGVSGTSCESSGGPRGPFYAGLVPLPLESVPNLSEGRDRDTLSALSEALSAPARLL